MAEAHNSPEYSSNQGQVVRLEFVLLFVSCAVVGCHQREPKLTCISGESAWTHLNQHAPQLRQYYDRLPEEAKPEFVALIIDDGVSDKKLLCYGVRINPTKTRSLLVLDCPTIFRGRSRVAFFAKNYTDLPGSVMLGYAFPQILINRDRLDAGVLWCQCALAGKGRTPILIRHTTKGQYVMLAVDVPVRKGEVQAIWPQWVPRDVSSDKHYNGKYVMHVQYVGTLGLFDTGFEIGFTKNGSEVDVSCVPKWLSPSIVRIPQ